MRKKLNCGLLLSVFLLCSSYSKADEICPSGTVGLCDPDVFTTIVETIEETSHNDGQGTLTTTVTTLTTTVDTVVNNDSGDVLDGDNDFVTTKFEGNMEKDWGGQGPASISSGATCGALGTDKCAQITGSGNSTSVMGVSGMGTTFKQTIDISDLNISSGGKTTYSIKVDKQDASDSIYMHITGKDGNTTSFAGTDVLSATGVSSGYQEYTGSFNFANALTSIIVEIGGRDSVTLAIGPMFDDVSINVLYNVISQIILQTITTVEQYVYTNGDATQEEIDIVKDIFEHNDTIEQPDGSYDLEPIDNGGSNDTSYEMVELELELEMDFEMPDMNADFDMPDINMEPPITDMDVEMEMEMDMLPPPDAPPPPEPELSPPSNTEEPEPEVEAPVEKIVVAEAEPEPETEPETKEEVKEEPKEEVKEEPKEEVKEVVKEEPKKEVEVVKKKIVKPKTKEQKKDDKQKAGTKIVKKMGDKGRYDSSNQLKTLIIMNVISDTKTFFNSQIMLQDTQGFFSTSQVPDAVLSDNNVAAYLMLVGSSQKMNSLINSQYK